MKFSTRSAAIVTALAMSTTGALILSQSNADAATIATVHSGVTARLYTANGSLVNNRALGANTPWLIGKTANINGETMYQVSTNEYLSSKDSTLNGQATPTSNKTVITIGKYMQPLFRDDTGLYSNRALDYGSSWQVGKTITNNKGETYYQVSTHEFVKKSANTTLNRDVNPQYVADFGFDKDTPSTDTNTNTTKPSTDTNTHVTTPSTDTNTDNGHTDTTAPSTDTDTNTGSTSTQGDDSQSAYQQAILADVNKARAEAGLNPLTLNAKLNASAATRAQEISTDFSHTRPDGSTNASAVNDPAYVKGSTFGENIAQIHDNDHMSATRLEQEHLARFLGEPGQGHYKNWQYVGYKTIGIAVYHVNGYYYVVEDMGTI